MWTAHKLSSSYLPWSSSLSEGQLIKSPYETCMLIFSASSKDNPSDKAMSLIAARREKMRCDEKQKEEENRQWEKRERVIKGLSHSDWPQVNLVHGVLIIFLWGSEERKVISLSSGSVLVVVVGGMQSSGQVRHSPCNHSCNRTFSSGGGTAHPNWKFCCSLCSFENI